MFIKNSKGDINNVNTEKMHRTGNSRLGKVIRQKKAQIFLKKTDSSDIYIRRLIIIGGFATDYFPELLRFTPQETEAENEIEFAPLTNFFLFLSMRRNLLDRLMKKKPMHTNAHLRLA